MYARYRLLLLLLLSFRVIAVGTKDLHAKTFSKTIQDLNGVKKNFMFIFQLFTQNVLC